MIYKIGNIADMRNIVFDSDNAKQIVYHYASVLTYEYGANRNIDTDDGGYILYATKDTNSKEIKALFDYTQNLVEYVNVQDDICSALFILNNDYVVVIITSLSDTPLEILKEI